MDKEKKQEGLSALRVVGAPKGFGRSNRRNSVSAEVTHPGDEKWEKKVVPKTEEQLARLTKAVENSFLFGALTDDQKKDIFDCMTEVKVKAGQVVIRQYDEGDFFYVIDSGKYDVFKKEGFRDDEGEAKQVFAYDGSGSFGELALMYNCPRAATVKASTDGVLWAVDRATFRHVVVAKAAKERAKREEFLEQVPILVNLTKQERAQIADIVVPKEYKDGEYVVRQGEKGETFYIIESGTAVVTQVPIFKSQEVEINRMKTGDYFGEGALLTSKARGAHVKAAGPLKVYAIDAASFERLCGSLKTIMKRQMQSYKSAS